VDVVVVVAVGCIISLVSRTRSGVVFAVEVLTGVEVSVFVGAIFLREGVGVQLFVMLVTDMGKRMEAN